MRIDRAGWPFVAGIAAFALVLGFITPVLASVGALLLLFTLNFFRDPERIAPATKGVLIAPADGRIIRADGSRVSIFMNVFDVHVCRSPAAGTITGVRHERGRFLAAMKDEASQQNERVIIDLRLADGGDARLILVAGLIARRIVCRVREGQEISAGERVGIIRFGSRVDLDLPTGSAPAVLIGDRVIAGVSIVGRRPESPA